MDWAGLTLDKYHIIEPVDTSGMAQVYKAYQPDLDRYVAIKIIAADLDSNPTFREQFEREAKTLAKLEHPNILPIYDYGYYEYQYDFDYNYDYDYLYDYDYYYN